MTQSELLEKYKDRIKELGWKPELMYRIVERENGTVLFYYNNTFGQNEDKKLNDTISKE